MNAATEAIVARVARALGLERPEVAPLPGGGLNRSLRLRDARRDLVLRLPAPGAAALGSSRDAECAMQSLAAGAGLAPPVLLAWPGEGILVSAFVQGRVPAAEALRNPGFLRRLGAWFARLHGLAPPARLPPVDFGERALGYLRRLAGQEPAARLARIESLVGTLRHSLPSVPPAACHHDLHRHNLMETSAGALLAVDWEYAGPGDPSADLAACIRYHALDADAVAALLAGYGAGAAALAPRLDAQCRLFDCLWYGWTALAAPGAAGGDAASHARLLARLGG